MKVAVRLVCVFDGSFLSKEDLALKRDLILSSGLLGLKPRAAADF